MTNAPAGRQLAWLRERDESTRGHVIMLARSGMSFGEALQTSMEKKRLEWTIVAPAAVQSPGGGGSDEPSSKRARVQKQATPQKSKSNRTGTTGPGGVRICTQYNMGQCLAAKKCPHRAAHKCDLILPSSGKICGKEHRRSECPEYVRV